MAEFFREDVLRLREDAYLSLVDLGKRSRQPKQVLRSYERCLGVLREQDEEEVYDRMIGVLNGYALALREEGRLGEAIGVTREGVALAEKYHTHCHPVKHTLLANLACYYTENRQPAEAETVYRMVLQCKDPNVKRIA